MQKVIAVRFVMVLLTAGYGTPSARADDFDPATYNNSCRFVIRFVPGQSEISAEQAEKFEALGKMARETGRELLLSYSTTNGDSREIWAPRATSIMEVFRSIEAKGTKYKVYESADMYFNDDFFIDACPRDD